MPGERILLGNIPDGTGAKRICLSHASVLNTRHEQQTEELVIFFYLDPDAPEGARDTNAYLFVSVPFDLYETVETAEPEQTDGL